MINYNELDSVYTRYKQSVNMSYNELLRWSKNPLSLKAGLTRQPIRTNLRLLNKNKSEWTKRDIQNAKKSISYLARAKKIKSKNFVIPNLTMNHIALRNWGFDVLK